MKRALAAVLGVLMSAGVASATTLVVTCPAVSSATELTTLLNCPQFNLANLSSISIKVDGAISGSITLTNFSNQATNIGSGTTISQFGVGPMTGFAATPAVLFAAFYSTGPVLLAPSQTKTISGLSGNGSATILNAGPPVDLAPYIGAGTFTIPLFTFASPCMTAYTCSSLAIAGGGGQFGGSQATDATASAEVTYTYDIVPEPASLLLLGTGLLGAVLRHRRHARR